MSLPLCRGGSPAALRRGPPPPGRRSRATRPAVSYTYDAAYRGVPSWEIGRPQQAFVELFETGQIHGPVLDVGCGTGELSMFLARQGCEVLGIDLSALAIRQAREKARGRRIDVRFLVWDALELPMLGERWPPFATVVDSAMFHLLGDWERDRFVSGLSAVVASGSLYAVLGDIRRDSRSIYGITPSEIQARFSQAEGWELAFARRSVFERRWSVGDAWFVGVRRR